MDAKLEAAQKTLDDLFAELCDAETGSQLIAITNQIHAQFPNENVALEEILDDLAYFHADMPDKMIARLAQNRIKRLEGHEFKAALLGQNNGDLSGVELSNLSGTLFCAFFEDASHPGKVRYSMYCESGFQSHSTHDTYEQALNDAWDSGYRKIATGSLDAMFPTPKFQSGMAQAFRIQQGAM